MRWKLSLVVILSLVILGLATVSMRAAKAQHNPQACAREDDQARPEDRVACKCYETKDPCADGEARACKAYCKKDKCGCCQP